MLLTYPPVKMCHKDQKKKNAKVESKIKTKVIDGKHKRVRVEYVYETESKSESEEEESPSAFESPDSPVVNVQKVKHKKVIK